MRCAGKAALVLAVWLIGVSPAVSADLTEKMAPCLACHGAEGQSAIDNVPSLGAQPAPYGVIQLFMFREKLRVAEPMNELTHGLSDADLQAIADALNESLLPVLPLALNAEKCLPIDLEATNTIACQRRRLA